MRTMRTKRCSAVLARVAGALLGAVVAAMAGCMQVPEPLDAAGVFDDGDESPIPVPAEVEDELGRPPWDDVERDYSTWPRSPDPGLARLGVRQLRIHALWPTPIDTPCPTVMFAPLGPPLDGGPMFDRVTHRMEGITTPGRRLLPTEITPVHDHIGRSGLRLVKVAHIIGACTMGWSHTHCLVDSLDAYCPDGSLGDLERLIEAHGLEPTSLDAAGWLELVVVMTGAELIVVDGSLASECSPDGAVVPSGPEVVVTDHAARVRFTGLAFGEAVEHTVTIERGGRVRTEAKPLWGPPADELPG